MAEATRLERYDVEDAFNVITSIENFIQIHRFLKVIKGFLCIHLRSLNVSQPGLVKATVLENKHRGHLQFHHLHTIFHPNPPIGLNVIGGFFPLISEV
jgi:hypothetical protein